MIYVPYGVFISFVERSTSLHCKPGYFDLFRDETWGLRVVEKVGDGLWGFRSLVWIKDSNSVFFPFTSSITRMVAERGGLFKEERERSTFSGYIKLRYPGRYCVGLRITSCHLLNMGTGVPSFC